MIDLGAIAENWCRLKQHVGASVVCAGVVKADAYGLGMAQVAPVLAAAGCRQFFVAQLGEALALRRLMPAVDIGVLGGLLPGTEADMAAHRLQPVLNHLGEIAAWQGQALREGRPLPAFVHLDTGMNRLGLGPEEQIQLISEPSRLDGIALAAWISHLACADEADHPLTVRQLGRFRRCLGQLLPAPASLANSSGIYRGRAFHFQMVRPGVALYGVNPVPECANPMRAVVSVWGRILQVRRVDTGMTVGYGASHVIERPGRLATVGVGYADGYWRSLSHVGAVKVGGYRAPVVGRVSMDLVTVDVSAVPETVVIPGGLVEIVGADRSVDQLAAEADTIGYEVLTALGRRYRRQYVGSQGLV